MSGSGWVLRAVGIRPARRALARVGDRRVARREAPRHRRPACRLGGRAHSAGSSHLRRAPSRRPSAPRTRVTTPKARCRADRLSWAGPAVGAQGPASLLGLSGAGSGWESWADRRHQRGPHRSSPDPWLQARAYRAHPGPGCGAFRAAPHTAKAPPWRWRRISSTATSPAQSRTGCG